MLQMIFTFLNSCRHLHLLSLCSLLALAHPARAAVTNVAWYRLGENDPGGVSGLAVTNTTADWVGANHLKQFNSPLYANSVSAAAASRLSSSLSVNFNGTSQYLSNAIVSTAVDNFGLEAWVKPNATATGFYFITFNGFGAGGWGIYQSGNSYIALLGGVAEITSGGTASPETWAHVALVRDNGTATFYVNGTATGTTTLNPNAVVGGFGIGAYVQAPSATFFNGAIDEVRVFTFAAGQFSTNDLLLNFQRVVTLPATSVNPPSARLSGSANPVGLPTSAWFQWGTTTDYGNVTSPQAVGSGATNAPFSQVITGVANGFTYHFRAVASNSLGTAYGDDQIFFITTFQSVRRLTNGEAEMSFTGPANTAYLMEASTNLINWKLIAALHSSNSPALFSDPETKRFTQRFYRYQAFRADRQGLFYFDDSWLGENDTVLFRQPRFSGSTADFIVTGSILEPPLHDSVLTNSFPSGGPTGNVLRVRWLFAPGVVNPWVRLSTGNTIHHGNPIIEFGNGFCFDIYSDRDFYVTLGLRETNTVGAVGTDGGTTGTIEWVGGTVNNLVSPPLGRLVTAGKWQRLCFYIPAEPVRAFTGNGILESTTGKGVFEHLALVPVNYVPGVTNNVYLGNFQTVERIP